jgi:hypothetical protein
MQEWKQIFISLAELDRSICAEWHMDNGTSFFFGIPKLTQIQEDSFSNDVEFPFRFAEIVSIDIPHKFGKVVLNERLGEVAEAILQVNSAQVTISEQNINISIAVRK